MKTQKLILLFCVCLLASCSAATRLPGGAEAALVQYWRNLPAGGHNFQIVRAWPGLFPVEGYPGDGPRLEVWCVETLSEPEPAAEEPAMIWVVTRQAGESEWNAGLLMAMSSIWPYQACGVNPTSTLPIEVFNREVDYTP